MRFQNIRIDQDNRANKPEFYVADGVRLATATGVILIGKNQLLATHLVGQSMHLFEYSPADYSAEEIDAIDTQFGGNPTITDLIDFDGHDRILTSNFDDGSGTLYKVKNSKLHHSKDLPLNKGSGNCHGARFYDENTACLTTNANKIFFLDLSTSKIIARLDMPYHIKDICFLSSNLAVAPFALGSPTSSVDDSYASGLLYFSFDLNKSKWKVIDKIFVQPCAFDAICVDKKTNRYYITDQHGDRLIVAAISNNKLDITGQISGFDFPHGIDTDGVVMAVTNYGDSTLSIFNITHAQLTTFSGKITRRKSYHKGDIVKLWRYYLLRFSQVINGK